MTMALHIRTLEVSNLLCLAFSQRILKIETKRFKRRQIVMPLVGVATDIAYHWPSTIQGLAAILSSLLDLLDTSAENLDVIAKVRAKSSQIPDSSFLDIWLQRISYQFDFTMNYDEPLCRVNQKLGFTDMEQ